MSHYQDSWAMYYNKPDKVTDKSNNTPLDKVNPDDRMSDIAIINSIMDNAALSTYPDERSLPLRANSMNASHIDTVRDGYSMWIDKGLLHTYWH